GRRRLRSTSRGPRRPCGPDPRRDQRRGMDGEPARGRARVAGRLIWRRRTLRGAASSVGQIALLFGLSASLPRLVRRAPVAVGLTGERPRAERRAGGSGSGGQGGSRPRLRGLLPSPPARRLLLRLLPGGQSPRRRGPDRAGISAGLPPLRPGPA